MKAIRVFATCECLMDDVADILLEHDCSPVDSRAGLDWIPMDQSDGSINSVLQGILAIYGPDEVDLLEVVDYVETVDIRKIRQSLFLFLTGSIESPE